MPRIMVGWVDVYGGLWKNSGVFYVKVNQDLEAAAYRRGNLDTISTSRIWQLFAGFIRQLQRLLEEFQFFDVKVDCPEVDSLGVVRTWNLDIIFVSFLRTSEGSFAEFCCIFRTPSSWTRVPIFQPSIAINC